MTQPNRAQWFLICAITVILILCWPPDRGHGSNLLIKAMHWAVDPADSLPSMPPALPPGLGDNGDAVAAHDAIEADYYRHYNGSTVTRWRMDVKAAEDPFDATTERQILVASAAIAALAAWRLGKNK
jgi:hypothetical protein